MNALRLSTVKTLVNQDLYYALKSARGLLFLVFFGVFWLWVLWKLSSGSAQMLAVPEGGMILNWLFDADVARALFTDRSATLSAYYLIAMSTMPLFVLFAASDQTANDIGSKYMRFLAPRCNRIEIFIGRFVGAVLLIAISYAVVTVAAVLVAAFADNVSIAQMLNDGLLVMLSLIFYAIPFIALMSLCSVIVGSAGLSALVGISTYVVILIVISVINIKMSGIADVLRYLLPSGIKPLFIQLEWGKVIMGLIAVPIYVFAYGFLGWLIFSKRDI